MALFSLIAPNAVQAAETTDEVLAVSVSNFECVSKNLYRGAQPSHKALEQLAKGGVRTIIDLRQEGSSSDKESEYAQQLGMNYVHIPLGLKHAPSDKIAQAVSAVINPINQPVYVHCRQGADRTGTVCAVYRRLVHGWTYEKAYGEMRKHHFKPFLVGMKKIVKECDSKEFSNQMTIPVASLAPKSTQL